MKWDLRLYLPPEDPNNEFSRPVQVFNVEWAVIDATDSNFAIFFHNKIKPTPENPSPIAKVTDLTIEITLKEDVEIWTAEDKTGFKGKTWSFPLASV